MCANAVRLPKLCLVVNAYSLASVYKSNLALSQNTSRF